MALQSSGQISLNDLHVEAGGTTGTQASMNDTDIRGLVSAAANSQMTFSSFYGASSSITIASGNSTYVAAAGYSSESRKIVTISPHLSFTLGGAGYATGVVFTLNGRSSYLASINDVSVQSNAINMSIVDLSGGVVTAASGYPANAGWNSVTITGGGASRTYTRTSATFTNATTLIRVSPSSVSSAYGASTWQWSSTTAFLPASNNTTSFTVTIS
jgi:hypothetical protein